MRTLKTAGGDPARLYADDCGGDFPKHGAIYDRAGGLWRPVQWTEGGQAREGQASRNDLQDDAPLDVGADVLRVFTDATQRGATKREALAAALSVHEAKR